MSEFLPKRPSVLLCDAGNTLVFFEARAAAGVLREQGVEVDASRLKEAQAAAGRRYQRELRANQRSHEDGWRTYIKVLLTEAGVEGPLEEWVDLLRCVHDEFNLWRAVPDGLIDALQRLRAAYPPTRVGVVSNSEGKLGELFERVGLASAFEVVVDSAIEGVRKPDPALFMLALERMGVKARDAVYVGDLPEIDVQGARNAGIEAVLVDPFDHYPDFSDAPRVQSVTALIDHWLG